MKRKLIRILTLVCALCFACGAVAAAADTAQDETQDASAQTGEAAAAPDAQAEQTAAAEQDGEHTHCSCGEQTLCADGRSVTYEPLQTLGGALPSGAYYLTQDTYLDEPLRVEAGGQEVFLCLNGYKLALQDGAEGYILYLAVGSEQQEPSRVYLSDCGGSGVRHAYYLDEDGMCRFDDGSFSWQEGYIAAGEKGSAAGLISGATAGALCVGDYNELYLYGLTIAGNSGRYGGGVVIAENAFCAMRGVRVTGNAATGAGEADSRLLGGGVYCAGKLELSDEVSISGNRAQDEANDLWLNTASQSAELAVGARGLSADSRILLSRADGEGTVLSGYAEDFSACFASDTPAYALEAQSSEGFFTLTLIAAEAPQTPETDAPETDAQEAAAPESDAPAAQTSREESEPDADAAQEAAPTAQSPVSRQELSDLLAAIAEYLRE